MTLPRLVTILALCAIGLGSTGCVGLFVGAAATGGIAVAEEDRLRSRPSKAAGGLGAVWKQGQKRGQARDEQWEREGGQPRKSNSSTEN